MARRGNLFARVGAHDDITDCLQGRLEATVAQIEANATSAESPAAVSDRDRLNPLVQAKDADRHTLCEGRDQPNMSFPSRWSRERCFGRPVPSALLAP